MTRVVFKGKTKNGLEIFVRYPTEKDVGSMHKFINALSAERTYVRNQGEVITLDQEKQYLNNQLKKINTHRSIQLLVFNKNKLVGISGVEMKDKAQKHIGNFGISIDHNFRDQKIGSKLMEIVFEESQKNLPDLKTVVLTVFANNKVALDMYKKYNFIRYGRLPRGLNYRDNFVDEIYMYKEL